MSRTADIAEILESIKSSVDDLIIRSQAGGDKQEYFERHLSLLKLTDVDDMLASIYADTDDFGGSG